MPYLLNVVYLLLIVLCSPYLVYAAIRYGKYREGWSEKFLGRVPLRTGQRPCIWLHAVSVGEVNLLQPLLASLSQQRPTWECVISTTTRTGFSLGARNTPAIRSSSVHLTSPGLCGRRCAVSAPTCWCSPNWSCGPT